VGSKLLNKVNISFYRMLDLVMICIYLHNIWNVKFDGFDTNYALDVNKKMHSQKQKGYKIQGL
jgi:hypothetical protein